MKMSLLAIEIENIRRFPKLKIDFTDKKGNPINHSFVMMRNGTGKTTIITLIKALLDGSADSWTKEEVASYKPKKREASEGSFKLATTFDSKTYNYILKLDYQKGTAKTYSSSVSQGGLGERRFPAALNDLFTPSFVNRFVFDGEQAEKILDNKSSEAEEAIKYLYRLDVFDEIKDSNEVILKSIQDSQGGGKGTDQSIKNLRTRQAGHKETIRKLKERLGTINEEIDKKDNERKQIVEEIRQSDSKHIKLNEDKQKANDDVVASRTHINDVVASVLENIKSPYLVSEELSRRMTEFGESMTKLKLPKSTSKDFFLELSNQENCICGRKIGEQEKKHIREHADSYLGTDQQAVLNSVKSGLISCTYESVLPDLYKELEGALSDYNKANNRLAAAERKLEEAGGQHAEELRQRKEAIIEELAKLKSERDQIESKDDADERLTEANNLYKAQKAYDELDEKIATATTTNAARYRKRIVDEVIELIKAEATARLKTEIINKTNEKIKKVITDDDIRIESIENYIQLSGRDGASAGQTLSVAYCFLGTLFEDAELIFPFIIDSPCGSMDFEKRQAVADILPALFNQIVSFVMSAEVERFADRYYTKSDAQFITIIADQNTGTVEQHNDKDFFDKYQRENREEE